MNGYEEEERPHCYFHPTEIIVGICPLCLRERLLNLASKQGHLSPPTDTQLRSNKNNPKKPSATFPKVFASSNFLHSSASRHRRRSSSSDPDIPTSHEDSFISIKFEEDGRASWTHKTGSGISSKSLKLRLCNNTDNEPKMPKSMVEHLKRRKPSGWRKRIGQLFHLMPWTRSTKATASQTGGSKVEHARHSNCWTVGR